MALRGWVAHSREKRLQVRVEVKSYVAVTEEREPAAPLRGGLLKTEVKEI